MVKVREVIISMENCVLLFLFLQLLLLLDGQFCVWLHSLVGAMKCAVLWRYM